MTAPRATWAVQAMVDEPLPLLLAFVAHYLDLGADAIWLHLDRPCLEAEAALAGEPRVHLVSCDAAWWERVTPGGRPPGHPARQLANIADLHGRLEQDWLLVVDADEFLVMEEDPGTVLARQPAEIDYVQVNVAELVRLPDQVPRSIFEGGFRKPDLMEGPEAGEIYGEALEQFLRRIVAAHGSGKSWTRKCVDAEIRLHRPYARPEGPEPRGIYLDAAIFAHCDALTPLHYMVKLLGKHLGNEAVRAGGRRPGARHPTRDAQIALAVASCTEPEPLALIDLLHRLTPDALEGLKRHGYYLDLAFAPDRAARRRFPGLALDFSPDAFDRALRLRHAETFSRMGLGPALSESTP